VFGGFVALALWLPRYLIGVYGLDITTAGMIGAAYSVPASLFRIYGGVLSDKYGARRVMYWTFGVSVAACFILSYPPTEYIVQGIRGPMTFRLKTGLLAFTCSSSSSTFASLARRQSTNIPVYYPNTWLSQRRGGRRPGGFILPILFGLKRPDRRQSCFMRCCGLALSLVWMHAIRAMRRALRRAEKLPGSRDAGDPGRNGRLCPIHRGLDRRRRSSGTKGRLPATNC
jgi:NNP family nitrate/nitrite transporter-like MFS transporter